MAKRTGAFLSSARARFPIIPFARRRRVKGIIGDILIYRNISTHAAKMARKSRAKIDVKNVEIRGYLLRRFERKFLKMGSLLVLIAADRRGRIFILSLKWGM